MQYILITQNEDDVYKFVFWVLFGENARIVDWSQSKFCLLHIVYQVARFMYYFDDYVAVFIINR